MGRRIHKFEYAPYFFRHWDPGRYQRSVSLFTTLPCLPKVMPIVYYSPMPAESDADCASVAFLLCSLTYSPACMPWQTFLMSLAGTVVTMAGHEHLLAIITHAANPLQSGDQVGLCLPFFQRPIARDPAQMVVFCPRHVVLLPHCCRLGIAGFGFCCI